MFTKLLVLCLLCTYACAQDQTILDYLLPGGYTKLFELILGAGLSSEFSDTNDVKTLFAPTDAAFNALPPAVLVQLSTNATLLKQILTGHVISGQSVLDVYIRDGMTKTADSGSILYFNKYSNGVKTVDGAVLGGDKMLSNGVLHTVDKVLLPIDKSVSVIVAESDPEFRDLFGLLVLTHLFGTLSAGGPFTVFAPTDAAFEKVDVASLIANTTLLTEILKYHVVPGTYWSPGLTDGMTLDTVQGGQLTVNIGAGGATVNNVRITATDIGATNGVIHVIDTVLTPP